MRTVWLLSLALVGCADALSSHEEAPHESVHEAMVGGDSSDDDMQGRHVLGLSADALLVNHNHFRVPNVSVSPTGWTLSVTSAGPRGVNGANLVATNASGTTHTGADPWFKTVNGPLTMGVAGGRQLRVRDVATEGASTLYYLDIYNPNTGQWTDYCDGKGGAFALAGGINERRIHTTGPTITFACSLGGVAGKCVRWGYVPGTRAGGPTDTNWNHHQACIQMANAAYCGGALSGLPFTREETPIVIQDFVPNYAKGDPTLKHPAVHPGDPDAFYFEAAWRPDGLPPLCLSRLRWQSLPPNPCPTELPDPRFDPNPEGKFCEEYTNQDFIDEGVLIINGSKMMDGPLGKWRNPSNNDVVSTLRGFHSKVNGDTSKSIFPFPGYTDYLGTDGMILRNLTGTLDENVDMVKLYIQHDKNSDRLVLSDGVDLLNHTHNQDRTQSGDFEGYAFKNTLPNLRTLKVCRTGVDYTTTTNGCANPLTAPMYALPAP